jgi:hypothetical protein
MNPGVAPLDPNTPVGRLRALVGDTSYKPLEPPVEGQGDYNVYSDADLEAFLTQTDGNELRAAGHAFRTLAAVYAASGRSIRTDDLNIDTTKRGSDFLAIAKSFFDEADAADEKAAMDFVKIVPFGGRTPATYRPEATPYPL